jgi:hypothetical protein
MPSPVDADHWLYGGMQWLRRRGFPWGTQFMGHAATSASLGLIEWAAANGCSTVEWPKRVPPALRALQYDRLDIADWFAARQRASNVLLQYAACWGQVEALQVR